MEKNFDSYFEINENLFESDLTNTFGDELTYETNYSEEENIQEGVVGKTVDWVANHSPETIKNLITNAKEAGGRLGDDISTVYGDVKNLFRPEEGMTRGEAWAATKEALSNLAGDSYKVGKVAVPVAAVPTAAIAGTAAALSDDDPVDDTIEKVQDFASSNPELAAALGIGGIAGLGAGGYGLYKLLKKK